MDDVQTMSHVLSQTAAELIGGMITGIVSLLMLFVYDWRLALYLAACLPVVILVMSLSRKISEGTNKKNRNKKLSVSAGLQEYLENIKLLRTTEAMEDYQQGLNKKIKRIIPGLVLYELLAGLSISVSYNVMRIGLGLVIIFGSGMLAAGEISLFKFLIFLYAAVRIYEPLTSACEHLGDFIASLVGAGRVTKLLEEPEQGGSENVSVSSFDIRFDHVSFAYNNEEVLHDVSFTAKQGEITALVGPSGSGKSTLARLAARFWDVKSGTVSIGGEDLRKIAPEQLLKNYSIVFQDVVLFNDTIYNNIKIGKEDATEEEVYAAAKLAHADQFIQMLPKGYDTMLSGDGEELSQGQRQLLSIARAAVADPPVLILDEATSSIDTRTEKIVQDGMDKLMKGRTTFVIAHRLSTVKNSDCIMVLEQGRIIERGNHDELISQKGRYYQLYTGNAIAEG